MSRGRRHQRRPRVIRSSATQLPDAVVERIIVDVVRRLGYLDVELCVSLLLAERERRWRRLWLVPSPLRFARESAPTGVA